ncbi:MAG: hypothetical protein J3K34DRAFT_410465 [Monoraphidium minutum]|nr:MAG: hypothetical protein J3K34DRAFT_410465 [Monoraphidium minutum]
MCVWVSGGVCGALHPWVGSASAPPKRASHPRGPATASGHQRGWLGRERGSGTQVPPLALKALAAETNGAARARTSRGGAWRRARTTRGGALALGRRAAAACEAQRTRQRADKRCWGGPAAAGAAGGFFWVDLWGQMALCVAVPKLDKAGGAEERAVTDGAGGRAGCGLETAAPLLHAAALLLPARAFASA